MMTNVELAARMADCTATLLAATLDSEGKVIRSEDARMQVVQVEEELTFLRNILKDREQ